MPRSNKKIGEMLIEEGIISKEQLKDALEEQKRTGLKIGEILIKFGYIDKDGLWTFLAYQRGYQYINLDEVNDIKKETLSILPEAYMRSEKVLPINKQGRILVVAMADPDNIETTDSIKTMTKCDVDQRLVPEEDIEKKLNKLFGAAGEVAKAQSDGLEDVFSSNSFSSSPSSSGAGAYGSAPSFGAEGGMKITRSVFGQQPPAAPPVNQPAPQSIKPAPVQPASFSQQDSLPPLPEFNQQFSKPAPVNTPVAPQIQKPQAPAFQKPAPDFTMGGQGDAPMNFSQSAPVNTFLTNLISQAYEYGATDVHVEPLEDRCRIRIRRDGVLYEWQESPPKTMYVGILNKIKELAQMNVEERVAPQESKFSMNVNGKKVDMGVYTFPTILGERIVLKIIRTGNVVFQLSASGMDEVLSAVYRKCLNMPQGLVLIAGPTSSGKTTTLYASINELNQPGINIFTVDDTSSNYIIKGVNHAKVNRKDYGQVINFLRDQDCDVIATGDIANKEAAEAIIDATSSGHLVISKVRAGDPFQALQTIVNFGVEPYILYSNTQLVVSQRLLRKNCDSCKAVYQPTPDVISLLEADGVSLSGAVFSKGAGCRECANTGYNGRTAIYEGLFFTEKIKEMLLAKESTKKLREENARLGLKTLKEAALAKVFSGTTTIDEYLKIG